MPGHEINWNGTSSTTIPELIIGPFSRELIGAPRTVFSEIPGREGDWVFPETRGNRKISTECSIQAATAAGRRTAFHDVSNWIDVHGQAKLILSDEPLVYYEATLIEPPSITEWRNWGQFDLNWRCNPYSLDLIPTTEVFTADANETHVWDTGTEVYTYPIITITPNNGSLLGFVLQKDGFDLMVDGPIAEDTSVTVNCIAAIVTTGVNTDSELTGVYDPSNAFMAGVEGRFPVLTPGNNSLRFMAEGGSVATDITVTIYYRKRYRK